MSLSAKKVKKELEKLKVRPSKRMGQNFLVRKKVAEKIVGEACLEKEDVVVEVGPGLGALTEKMAPRVRKVVAVEKDRRLADFLKERFKDFENVKVIKGDILEIMGDLKFERYKVVSNLPFSISKFAVRKFLEKDKKPEMMVLLVQKEVGKDICAAPPRMSLLSVGVQFYAEVEFLGKVARNAFWPQPDVSGGLVRLGVKKMPEVDKDLFFKVARAGFALSRKQLKNSLSSNLSLSKEEVERWLSEAGISPARRPETLKVSEWIKLTKNYPG